MKIHAAIAWAGAPFRIEACELDAPRENEVLVEVEACGICHTDLAARDGEYGTPLPAVLGHEGVGRILRVGDGVYDFAVGDRVLLLYQAANRDERVYDDPDAFRIDRASNPHLAFGFGPHYCLGANLARMEIKVVFEELFRRLPDIEVTRPLDLPERSASAFVAGIHHLPARFTPIG